MAQNNTGLSPVNEMEAFSNGKTKKNAFTSFIRDQYYNLSYHAKAAATSDLSLNLILTCDSRGR
jgi:hypothetical protein